MEAIAPFSEMCLASALLLLLDSSSSGMPICQLIFEMTLGTPLWPLVAVTSDKASRDREVGYPVR